MTFIHSPNRIRPLVSVVIPAYNAAYFIERTLQSVLNQTYHPLEILVIDDGSTDATADIVRRFAAADQRLALYHQANAGVAAARNYGIEKAKGQFIAPLDADDTWECRNLEKQVNCFLRASETVAMVYSWSVDIDTSDRLTGGARVSPYYGNIYPALLYQNIIGNASASLIRRRCLVALGGYNTDFFTQQAQGCEDWDLYLRLAKQYQVAVVPELLVGYRQAAGSMSTHVQAMAKSRQLTFQTFQKTHPTVYKQVSRWVASTAHLYAARKCFKAHQDAAAWDAFRQALQQDWLITLTTYSNCTLLMQILGQSLIAAVPSNNNPPPAVHVPAPLQERCKLLLRLMLTPFFFSWLIKWLRMYWITNQVSHLGPLPKTVPFWVVIKTSVEVQRRSQYPDNLVNYGAERVSERGADNMIASKE
jgi:glycosyltransferase involved in cell wall biosynthesis